MEIECLRLDFHVYDMAIRCQRMQVEALGNRVLETRFPIWLFQILKSPCLLSYSHSHPHPLTLKPKHSHSHTNWPTLTVSASPTTPSLVLSLSQPHRRRCRSSSHSLSPTPTPSHSHTNQSTHTVSASPTPPSLVLPLSQPHRSRRRSYFILFLKEVNFDWSSQSFEVLQSARSLKTKKKKVSPFIPNAKCKVCFTVCMLRNSGKNERIFCESSFFFFFLNFQ